MRPGGGGKGSVDGGGGGRGPGGADLKGRRLKLLDGLIKPADKPREPKKRKDRPRPGRGGVRRNSSDEDEEGSGEGGDDPAPRKGRRYRKKGPAPPGFEDEAPARTPTRSTAQQKPLAAPPLAAGADKSKLSKTEQAVQKAAAKPGGGPSRIKQGTLGFGARPAIPKADDGFA